MLLVKTKIGPSKIHGTGLFAAEFIPKGTPVWELTPSFDMALSQEELAKFPYGARQRFLHYCYKDKDTEQYILCSDDARFFNHSEDPNTDGKDVATKDIGEGEEITYNYREEDGDYARKFRTIGKLSDFELRNLPT